MSLIQIVINDLSEIPIPFDAESYLRSVLNALDIETGSFEYSFVDKPTILDVNQTYLGHDYVTDIITFPLDQDPIQGDVYICVDEVQENAMDLGHLFEFELKIVMIHGVLHLLGYTDYTDEDRAEMDRMQLELFNRLVGC